MLITLLFLLQVNTEIPFIQKPHKQTVERRDFREFTYENFRKLELKEVFMPGMVKYRDGAAYVLDYQPFPRILKIDPLEGNILIQYGKQRGAGPGDLARPMDFTITKNGEIWIADFENSRISVFNPDGEPEKVILHKEIPYKISSNGHSGTVAVASYLSSKVSLIDRSEKIIWQSKELTEVNHSAWNNILSAFVVNLGNRQALQVGNYAGFIAKYDENGHLEYLREQVAHQQNPVGDPVEGLEHLVFNVNRTRLDYAVVNGFHLADRLVLFVQRYGENRQQTLDFYTLSDGSYQYSYKLENSFRDLFIGRDGLIAGLTSDGTLYLYQTKHL
jgi:hypothetical protein